MERTFGALVGAEIRERREIAAMTQKELGSESFPDMVIEGAERRVREIEAGTFKNPRAKSYQPLCDTLNITRAEIRAMKAEASDAAAQQTVEREEFEEDTGSIQNALAHPEGLTRAQLIFLTELFGFEGPEAQSDAALQTFLSQKAEEYRSYKALIDNLDERVTAIATLKGAAQHAAEQLNFDEVEMLLSRVDEVETTMAAETKEARASNALLRDRPEQAFAIYESAADGFKEFDVEEYARRRDTYRSKLYNHGLRYGGLGLALAANMIRPAIAALKDTTHCEEWASCTQNLAIALQTQGTRTDGPAGTALLAEAVNAYSDALNVFTREDHPVQWAMTTQNLAIALQTRGTRTDEPAGSALLEAAVTTYRDALTVFTREDHPVQSAMTTQNLAIALKTQGTRTDGPAGTALLAEAVTAYRDALTVGTREDHPVQWATTTQNLAGALATLGNRTEGPAGNVLLAEAINAFRDALIVRTREDHPVDWAETHENIARAERDVSKHPATSDPEPHWVAALAHVDLALEAYDPVHLPYYHRTATELRDLILARK